MALLPRIPHFYDNAIAEAYLDGRLKKGQRLDSFANEQIAQEWNIDELKVNYKFKQAKRYLALIRRGPGCLLYVKSSTWEIKLKDEQVDSLCGYLGKAREYLALEDLEKPRELSKAKAMLERQNFCTAKLIVESLLHFGWTHEKLAKSGTNLVKALGDYVDLLALEQGRICDKNGREFQDDQECEVDGENNGTRDDGGQGEAIERNNDKTDSAAQIPDVQENLSRVSKRRRIVSGQPPSQDRGRLDQQRTTSPQLHYLPGLQGIDANGQPLQHDKNTGQPSLRSSAHSDIPRHLHGNLYPRGAGGLDHDHAGMYSLDAIPNIDFAWIDWSNLNYDDGCVYSSATLPNIDFAEGDWNNMWEFTS
ncbi:hypothetical protein B0J12DRAFT_747439 [Macrophomina phaseolina]|uniref:Uncharacterized protein n=1 Tax=Macrophomina phaseolina TaxID=35725 RepID=A0ABQ8FSW2_9PEZI|nr:hypothetical protein B0J12DRAFT_747439 [Macrophomina phaseolina]